jgi:hypothetical protein
MKINYEALDLAARVLRSSRLSSLFSDRTHEDAVTNLIFI